MEYPIDKIHTVIGRHADVQVSLKDPLVSWQHAAILFHDGNFVLTDLDSANATQMSGASIMQAEHAAEISSASLTPHIGSYSKIPAGAGPTRLRK